MAIKKRENRSGSRWYTTPNGNEYPSVTTILGVIGKPALIAWSAKVERELVTNVSAQLYEDIAGTPKMSRIAYLNSLQTRLGKERAHTKELTKAGDIGSQAHALIEWNLKASLMYDAGPTPHVTDKATWAFMAWEDWKNSVKLKPVHVEQTVWSDTHGFAGTMDLFCELEVSGLISYFIKKNQDVPEILNKLVSSKERAFAIADWKTGKAIYPEAKLQNAAYRYAFREMGHGDPELGIIVRLPKNEDDPEFEVQIVEEPEDELLTIFLNAKHLWHWQQIGEKKYQESRKEQNLEKVLEDSLKAVSA